MLGELYIVQLWKLVLPPVAKYVAKRIVADSIRISSMTRRKIWTGIWYSHILFCFLVEISWSWAYDMTILITLNLRKIEIFSEEIEAIVNRWVQSIVVEL